ncbi:Reverse transcriptase zinc-binding domain [Sesbania bispinosa]|nr:Reverse transcriptase zinc-binding domain [Sesbania bispinosa]
MNSYVRSVSPEGQEGLKVSDLINKNTGSWKVSVIRSVFAIKDAENILNMPLMNTEREDELIWKLSRDGKFSVKSAYYHVTECMIDNSHLKEPGEWKLLWRLGVPNKVKMLLWRLLRGCLPVRTNLQRRGVRCPATCPLSEAGLENEWHTFFGCSYSVQCCQESGFLHELEDAIMSSEGCKEIVFQLLRVLPLQDKRAFVMIFWSLWKRRNLKVWEGVMQSVRDTVVHAR